MTGLEDSRGRRPIGPGDHVLGDTVGYKLVGDRAAVDGEVHRAVDRRPGAPTPVAATVAVYVTVWLKTTLVAPLIVVIVVSAATMNGFVWPGVPGVKLPSVFE